MSQFAGRSSISERRIAHRRKSHTRVWADPGGTSAPVDCLIIDRSDTGAKLMEMSGRPLPAQFALQVHGSRPTLPANVVWRFGTTVGVVFQV